MRRSIKNTERKSKSSKRKEKHKDEGIVSAEFDDENTDELIVQTVQSNAHEEDMKTASDRSTPVITENFPDDRKVSVDDEAADDSPEDVSWKVGKENAIQERAREKEAQIDKKRKEKQVRIERNERLREQKERKREREYSRLPVEVLQQVVKQQESQKLEDETSTDRKGGDHVTFASSSEEEEEDEDANTEENLAVKVVVIPKEIRKPKKIQQSANSFLQEHLFGDRLQRISAISDLDRSKKKDIYEPASKFCKKSSLC